MAKKPYLKYACELCRKRFYTEQAKWGHTPHCAARKPSLQLTSKPEAEAPRSTFVDSESRRPGPDSQEMRLLLLETHEEIAKLYGIAVNHAWWAEFLSRTARTDDEGHATSEEWGRLAQDLGDVERDFDQMKGRLRLDRSLLFNIYHRIFALQDAWLNYQARDFCYEGELSPKGEKVLREERELFADLIKVKKMLVASR